MKNKKINQRTNPLSRQVGTSPLIPQWRDRLGRLNSNRGQIAIIMLLVSAVVLTMGLSASRKAITDLRVDTDEESLKDAFNVAESGINNYLDNGVATYSTGSSGASAVVSTTAIGGGTSLASDGLVPSGSSQLFWLVNHNVVDGSIGTTYYTENVQIVADSSFKGALKIDYFYIDGVGNYKVKRFGYNCDASAIDSQFLTGFQIFNCSNIPLNIGTDKLLLIIVTPIGGATRLTLNSLGSQVFPIQGEELNAVGTAGNSVKTQIKTRNIYQIPSFLTEPIMARNVIGY